MNKAEAIKKLQSLKKIAEEMKLQDQSGNPIEEPEIKEVVAAVFNKAIDMCIEEIDSINEE